MLTRLPTYSVGHIRGGYVNRSGFRAGHHYLRHATSTVQDVVLDSRLQTSSLTTSSWVFAYEFVSCICACMVLSFDAPKQWSAGFRPAGDGMPKKDRNQQRHPGSTSYFLWLVRFVSNIVRHPHCLSRLQTSRASGFVRCPVM